MTTKTIYLLLESIINEKKKYYYYICNSYNFTVILLWVKGIIPMQIAKVYGTIYMDVNFPKMHLKYVNIE